MNYSDMYQDNGSFSSLGSAALGLHAVNYNTYMSQADAYAQEILRMDQEIANDPYNTALLERRQELLDLQQESIAKKTKTSSEYQKQLRAFSRDIKQ